MLYGIITSQLGDDQHVVQVQPGETSTVQELLKSEWAGLVDVVCGTINWVKRLTLANPEGDNRQPLKACLAVQAQQSRSPH